MSLCLMVNEMNWLVKFQGLLLYFTFGCDTKRPVTFQNICNVAHLSTLGKRILLFPGWLCDLL